MGNDRERIAEVLEQPCAICELEDNCDCLIRGIICPYQEKKADQILNILGSVLSKRATEKDRGIDNGDE